MRLKLLAATLALFALPASPGAQPAAPAARPKLLVVISVDQFSADLFSEYRSLFSGGLRRLTQGAVFPAGYQSHSATETCPGHSTILTGARPARTGIIANNWYDQSVPRADKYVYCSEDPRVPGSDSRNYTVSDYYLRVPALGDLMRQADPRSRVVAVAGKDRAAVMMGGRGPNERWWYSDGAFRTHAGRAAPPAVTAANQAVTRALAAPRGPVPLAPVCAARARAVPVEGGSAPVGDGRFARPAGHLRLFRASPDLDSAIVTLASRLRAAMRLGQGEATDLLIIGASATDYVGHRFGTQGSEMCLHLLALDRTLGALFTELDRTGIDYAVVLTSDHGGLDVPERARLQGMPAADRVDPALQARTLSAAIAGRLGLEGRVILGDGAFGDFYLGAQLSPADRRRVGEEALRIWRAHPQVFTVFSRDEIAASPPPSGPPDGWTLLQRARASFDPERSGDFYVVLRPQITPFRDTTNDVATHGSIWDYDRRVPILFWRRGMAGFEQPLAVETVDIMPTLAGLIGLPLAPGSVDGRCLDLDAGPGTSCRD